RGVYSASGRDCQATLHPARPEGGEAGGSGEFASRSQGRCATPPPNPLPEAERGSKKGKPLSCLLPLSASGRGLGGGVRAQALRVGEGADGREPDAPAAGDVARRWRFGPVREATASAARLLGRGLLLLLLGARLGQADQVRARIEGREAFERGQDPRLDVLQ